LVDENLEPNLRKREITDDLIIISEQVFQNHPNWVTVNVEDLGPTRPIEMMWQLVLS
jgi:hypothetical protein